jgi:DNA-binding XRE family transcriptional regulator
MLKKEVLEQDKETMNLEYELIYDLIKLRHELGLTQQQMADEAGVIRELIASLETRKKTPQITTLIKLLKPFGYAIGIKKINEVDNYE